MIRDIKRIVDALQTHSGILYVLYGANKFMKHKNWTSIQLTQLCCNRLQIFRERLLNHIEMSKHKLVRALM